MFKTLLISFGIFFLFTAFSIPEKIERKANKAIEKFYEIDQFSKETITISNELNKVTASEFSEGNLFKILSEETLIGYGYIGNAPSKATTFDYLVLFDKDFIITKSKVLVYREEYGGEIGSKRWLKQFNGASSNSEELTYNDDIIPISGATISVRSMTKAINNLLKSLAVLQKSNRI